jgi:signal transduction histidine kinase
MSGRRATAQPQRFIDKWPTFPSPPSGSHGSERLLLAAAYATTAAIYVASLLRAPELQQPITWIALTVLFVLFGLSIYLLPKSYERFWKRGGIVLFQTLLIFSILLVGQGSDYLPILYFIVIPMIYLSFTFGQAVILTLLCLGTMFLAYLILTDAETAFLLLLTYGGGFFFFAAASRALIEQQKAKQQAEQLLAELKDAHRQLRAYAVQVEGLAVAEERNRLAREIHDSLGHYLTAITMQLEAAGKLVAAQPERAAESIAKAEEMARDSLAEVRRSVAALRASPVDTATLDDAIGELIGNLHSSGLATTFTVKGKSQPLPIQVKAALYHAAQEGMTNVHKHANASAATVVLAYQPEQVALTIEDNGTGRRGKETGGFGLLGLQERIALLGGSLEADNCPEGGFQLRVIVPRQLQDG